MTDQIGRPRTVIVALDGSVHAERSLPAAMFLAGLTSNRLILLAADVSIPVNTRDGQPISARGYLAQVAERIANRRTDISISAVVESGQRDATAKVICQVAEREPESIVVLSTHGRGGLGRWLYGSVADEVLRHCYRPVCLVGPSCTLTDPPQHHPGRLLLTLDGSDISETILPFATHLAKVGNAEMLLLRVIEPLYTGPEILGHYSPERSAASLEREREDGELYLRGHATRLADVGVRASTEVAMGYPPAVIQQVARERDVDLLVLATHGHGGLARSVLGSTATSLVAGSTAPLLLVRPPGLL